MRPRCDSEPLGRTLGTQPCAGSLTDAFLRRVRAPASGRVEISDLRCPGLVFRVTAAGARSWSLRFRDPQSRKTTRADAEAIYVGRASSLNSKNSAKKSIGVIELGKRFRFQSLCPSSRAKARTHQDAVGRFAIVRFRAVSGRQSWLAALPGCASSGHPLGISRSGRRSIPD